MLIIFHENRTVFKMDCKEVEMTIKNQLISPISSLNLKFQSITLKDVYTLIANLREKVVSELQYIDAKK